MRIEYVEYHVRLQVLDHFILGRADNFSAASLTVQKLHPSSSSDIYISLLLQGSLEIVCRFFFRFAFYIFLKTSLSSTIAKYTCI